jgi:hypothetical protein
MTSPPTIGADSGKCPAGGGGGGSLTLIVLGEVKVDIAKLGHQILDKILLYRI